MRLGGLILYFLFIVETLLGLFLLPFMILWNPQRAKEAMRGVDQFNNAFYTNGIGRESLSSHSWRAYQSAESPKWARFVVWLTDKIQKGHCEEANRHEQPVVDFINSQE